jgi:hypothetical protein
MKNSQGNVSFWMGYKLHLGVTDLGIPVTAVVTGANVHDSQPIVGYVEDRGREKRSRPPNRNVSRSDRWSSAPTPISRIGSSRPRSSSAASRRSLSICSALSCRSRRSKQCSASSSSRHRWKPEPRERSSVSVGVVWSHGGAIAKFGSHAGPDASAASLIAIRTRHLISVTDF